MILRAHKLFVWDSRRKWADYCEIRKRKMNYLCTPSIMPTTFGRAFRHSSFSHTHTTRTRTCTQTHTHIFLTANYEHAQIPKRWLKILFLYSSYLGTLDVLPRVPSRMSCIFLTHPPRAQHECTAVEVCRLCLCSLERPLSLE